MIPYTSCYDPTRKHKIYVDLNESVIDTESRLGSWQDKEKYSGDKTEHMFADCLYLSWCHLTEHPKAAAAPIKVVGKKGGAVGCQAV